jgi:hypothetical protein
MTTPKIEMLNPQIAAPLQIHPDGGEAAHLYEQSSELSGIDAACHPPAHDLIGKGILVNVTLVIEFFQRADDLGDPDGGNNMSADFELGEGIEAEPDWGVWCSQNQRLSHITMECIQYRTLFGIRERNCTRPSLSGRIRSFGSRSQSHRSSK